MRPLTLSEATEFLEEVMDCPLDLIGSTVEAFILNESVDQVRADLDSYLAGIDDQIDPDSVEITPDRIDGFDMPAAKIVMRTEG